MINTNNTKERQLRYITGDELAFYTALAAHYKEMAAIHPSKGFLKKNALLFEQIVKSKQIATWDSKNW